MFDSEQKKQLIIRNSESKLPEESKEGIKKVLKENNSSENRVSKIANLTSAFENKEDYSKNYSIKEKQDRETEGYQVVSKSGYEKLEPQEIKYFFTRKG